MINLPKFEKEYFVDSKVSNYKDYRLKKFDQQADDIIALLGLNTGDRILDWGCATGGLVEALRKRGYNATGTDISHWAIEHGKEKGIELEYYNKNLLTKPWDLVISLDVFEHCPEYEIDSCLKLLQKSNSKRMIARIPVSLFEGGDYHLEVSRNDKTHITCHTRTWWKDKFKEFGLNHEYEVETPSIYTSDGVYCGVLKWEE